MDETQLAATVHACRALITERFPDDEAHGAAAMLLDDGTILTGTSPEALNSAVQVCHEIEPYCAAFRLGRSVIASVCLHREPSGRTLVLSPCGVCRERLATHGPDVLVAVADVKDSTRVVWRSLREALPDYWLTVFPDEIDATWTTQPTVRRGRPPVARRAHSDTRLPTTEHEVAELSAAVAQACARAPWRLSESS